MIPIARHSVLRAARSQLNPTRTLRQPASSALARLLSTLAVLEQRDGKLQNSSLSAIAAAQKLGGSVTGFLAGSGVKGTSAAEAAKIKGLEKVLAVENDTYEKVGLFVYFYVQYAQYATVSLTKFFSLLSCRACRRTMPLFSWRISKKANLRTLSLATQPLARAFCLEWLPCWMSSKFRTLPGSRARIVRAHIGASGP